MSEAISPFNSALEAGLRSLFILDESYPRALDLSSLVSLDYLVVHSGDVGGPASLHAPVPLRSGEILVRRNLVERGLMLMLSRRLLERQLNSHGVFYCASDISSPFVENLSAPYSRDLRSRAQWAVREFLNTPPDILRKNLNRLFEGLAPQFQAVERPTLL